MSRPVADILADPDRLARLPEVVALTGLSSTTIWRRERAGLFPRRRALGGSGAAVGWRIAEVREWLRGRPTTDAGAEG